jgi:hypothetical protein
LIMWRIGRLTCRYTKYFLAILLVGTISTVLGIMVIEWSNQNVKSNPLMELNQQFVLSDPDVYLTVESEYGVSGGEGWYLDDETAYASLDTNVVSGGPGVQYVFTNWAGDATGMDYAQSDPITMDANKTAIASWKTQYYLTVVSDHATPSGEGWKDAGIFANAHLDTGTESGGTGVQFVFTNWSDDSTGTNYATSDNILMSGPKTATAIWKTQYMLDVQSDHGTPSGIGWKDAGSIVYAGLDAGVVAGVTGTQYVFTSWSGNATGIDYSASEVILMNAPKTAVANWQTQYYFTVESDQGSPSGEGWKDAGVSVTAYLDTGVVAGATGTQYVFTNWAGDATGTDYTSSDSILMDAPKTATAVWKTQHYLTVESDHGTPAGEGWKDAETSVNAALDTGVVSGVTGVQYIFTNWGADATGTSYAASDSITMDGPKTATANWKTQYYLTVNSDHANPSGEGWKDAGTFTNAHLDTGTESGGTGIQYMFTNWSDDSTGTEYATSDNILMNGPKTATAIWKTQYMLYVQSDHGTPSGTGWKDAGSVVYAGLDAGIVAGTTGIQYVFASWSGDSTGTDYSASEAILMNAPKTAVANWITQYYLTVESDHAIASGGGWKDQGSSAIASVDADVVASGTGIQYMFTNWGSDATGSDYSASDGILMDAPKTATANWKTQYFLTATTDHGTISGDGWIDSGIIAHLSLDSGIVSGGLGTRYVFTNWIGDASGTDYSSSDSILMDGPKTASANWKTQYILNLTNDYNTSTGGGWKDSGTTAFVSLGGDMLYTDIVVRHLFTSWGGDATGFLYTQSDPILMDGPKTVAVNWLTQYYLAVESDHGTPSGEGWMVAGSIVNVSLDTDLVTFSVGTRYLFTGWGGNATGSNYTASNDIIMDSPKTAIANWVTQYHLNCTTFPEGLLPPPTWTPYREWFDSGTNVTLEAKEVEDYTFGFWTIDDLDIAIFSEIFNITMDSPHLVMAHYFEVTPTTSTSPSSSTSPTPTSPPPNNSLLIIVIVGGGGITLAIIILIIVVKKKPN